MILVHRGPLAFLFGPSLSGSSCIRIEALCPPRLQTATDAGIPLDPSSIAPLPLNSRVVPSLLNLVGSSSIIAADPLRVTLLTWGGSILLSVVPSPTG